MGSDQERAKQTDDELYELEWNFKLLIRTAFPDGIAVQQIESQYAEFVGKKLEFDTFKSETIKNWADLFSKNPILKDTFFVRRNTGAQLVKIQKSNISYTKKEIQRVIQLGCYREHKRKLNLESEEKAKPVVEKQKPKLIDGSTQVEITKTETKDKEVQTDDEARIPLIKMILPPPPPPQLAPSYRPVSAAPVRNVQPTLAPTSAAAANVNPTAAVTAAGNCSTQAAKRIGKAGTFEGALEPVTVGKHIVGNQTALVDSEVRGESSISGTIGNHRMASSILRNGPIPMQQSASISSNVSGKRPSQQPLLSFNCHIPNQSLETKAGVVPSTPGIPLDQRSTIVKRSIPTDDMQSSGSHGTTQKKQKTGEEERHDVLAEKIPARCVFPAYDSRSSQSEWLPTSPSSGTSSEGSSPSLYSSRTPSFKFTDSNESTKVLQPQFLQELDGQVETDLKRLSTFPSSSPWEEVSVNASASSNRLVPPPAPRLSFSIFPISRPSTYGIPPPATKFSSSWRASSSTNGVPPPPAPRLSFSSSSSSPFPTSGLIPPPASRLSSSPSPSTSSALLVNLALNENILKKFEPELTRVSPSFLRDCIDMLKGVTLFDQPLADLTYSPIGNERIGLNTSNWCAYLVQDNTPATHGRQRRGFYFAPGQESKTYFLTERGWILDTNLEIPPQTLLYGEFVIRQDRRNGQLDQIFDIIDAGYLNGKDLSDFSIAKRRRQCTLFFSKPRFQAMQIKVKDFLFLCHVEETLKRMLVREKEVVKQDAFFYTSITGVQIVRIKSGADSTASSMFGFGESVQNRYLITWPPISDSTKFPGPNITSELSLRFFL